MTTAEFAGEVSRHKCLIYDGHPKEQLRVIVPFILQGFRDNYRCLYLGDPETVAAVRSALVQEGLDVEEQCRRGTLVLSSDRSHLDGGAFDPCALVEGLSRMIDEAVREGYSGLCATGDMAWELGEEKNFKRLLEYEALLEQLFREKPLVGICQYRSDSLPQGALRDALTAHQSVYLGEDLRQDNLFYVPPEILLGGPGGMPGDTGRWMCDQIRRVIRAERDRDQAMARLSKSEDEQRGLADQLADLNRDLERRVRERTEDLEGFASSVSHDLRAPLRAMTSFAEMLLEEKGAELGKEGRERLERILQAAGRMRQLIDALLELARTGRARMSPEDVDMKALATSVIQELTSDSKERKALTQVANMPHASGDRALLRQVFANLIGNALKYSAGRSRPNVEVGASPGSTEVVYWVRDNGVGFEMKESEKLFQVFQRLHPQSEFEGSGVGLALVKRIVQRHGGRVWAEGRPDRGATFYFALPAKT